MHDSQIRKSNGETQQILNPILQPAIVLVPEKSFNFSKRADFESKDKTTSEAKYPDLSQKSELKELL